MWTRERSPGEKRTVQTTGTPRCGPLYEPAHLPPHRPTARCTGWLPRASLLGTQTPSPPCVLNAHPSVPVCILTSSFHMDTSQTGSGSTPVTSYPVTTSIRAQTQWHFEAQGSDFDTEVGAENAAITFTHARFSVKPELRPQGKFPVLLF